MIGTADVDEVAAARAVTCDGVELGEVLDVYLDARRGGPTWVAVAGEHRRSIVTTDGATISNGTLVVAPTAAAVRRAPNVESVAMITPDEEDRLTVHYEGEQQCRVTPSGSRRDTRPPSRLVVPTERKSA